jgi:hypothetical protein
MKEETAKLKLIKLIMEVEEQLHKGRMDEFWYNDKFDSLFEEDLLGLEFKYNLLKRKLKENA